jgi:hypothetical protein
VTESARVRGLLDELVGVRLCCALVQLVPSVELHEGRA